MNSQSNLKKNIAAGIRLTSHCTEKLQISKKYGSGTTTEIQINGTE